MDEASVTLMKNRKPRSVAFTGALAVHPAERQYEAGFGPCLDAAASGATITVPDTAAETIYAETIYRDFAAVAAQQASPTPCPAGCPSAPAPSAG